MAAPRSGAGARAGSEAAGWERAAAQLQDTLAAVMDHVVPRTRALEYRVVGSAAMALQGVPTPLPTSGIDLLFRERQGVDLFGEALATMPGVRCRTPPEERAGTPDYWARYMLVGAEARSGGSPVATEYVAIDLASAGRETDSDSDQVAGRGPWSHYSTVRCGAHDVPAVALELVLLTALECEGARRPNTYPTLLEHLRRQGCDVDLVRRGLADRGSIPEDLQRETLERLRDAGRAG